MPTNSNSGHIDACKLLTQPRSYSCHPEVHKLLILIPWDPHSPTHTVIRPITSYSWHLDVYKFQLLPSWQCTISTPGIFGAHNLLLRNPDPVLSVPARLICSVFQTVACKRLLALETQSQFLLKFLSSLGYFREAVFVTVSPGVLALGGLIPWCL